MTADNDESRSRSQLVCTPASTGLPPLVLVVDRADGRGEDDGGR